MTFNLLRERWIPVRRASGVVEPIRPDEIAGSSDPPIVVESNRSDFNSAITQFLVGLVQGAAAPDSRSQWRALFREHPTSEQLGEAFANHEAAFDLDGDGPRFFQDLTLTHDRKMTPIADLLVDEANAELFTKDGRILELSYSQAAIALMTLQMNAPSGGVGHRTSLRGGGPLTCFVLGADLWETVWLNVLTGPDFHELPGDSQLGLEASYPWLAPTRTSRKGEAATLPEHIHPGQHFWGMPRRIRLRFDGAHGQCSLTGAVGPTVRAYSTLNYGVNYEGALKHPLTPYRRPKPDALPNPKKGRGTRSPYRDWPALVLGGKDSEPARVVQAFTEDRRDRLVERPRLWSSGFDMDNMKARSWCDTMTPLWVVDEDQCSDFSTNVARLAQVAENVRRTLNSKVKAALSRRPEDLKKTDAKARFATINETYWSSTEDDFFASVSAIRDRLDDADFVDAVIEDWIRTVGAAALAIFDRAAQTNGDLRGLDIKRLVRARSALRAFTSVGSRKLRKLAGLPITKKGNRA